MNTEFHFRSTLFNCTEPKEHFVNESCFGDDLAGWLIERLEELGYKAVKSPESEDYGWYFTFLVGGTEHCVVVGFQPNDASTGDQWIGWIERQTSFLSSIFGGRNRNISPEAIQAIDAVLRSSPEIKDLSWHEPGTLE